jgi:hypothetical protein
MIEVAADDQGHTITYSSNKCRLHDVGECVGVYVANTSSPWPREINQRVGKAACNQGTRCSEHPLSTTGTKRHRVFREKKGKCERSSGEGVPLAADEKAPGAYTDLFVHLG